MLEQKLGRLLSNQHLFRFNDDRARGGLSQTVQTKAIGGAADKW